VKVAAAQAMAIVARRSRASFNEPSRWISRQTGERRWRSAIIRARDIVGWGVWFPDDDILGKIGGVARKGRRKNEE
jgi:hypothetical protein